MTKEEAIKYLEKRKEKALMLMENSKADTPINNKVRGILTRKIEVLDMAISALSDKKGDWINETPHTDGCPIYTCSECGRSNLWESPFCPSCGADMRGE